MKNKITIATGCYYVVLCLTCGLIIGDIVALAAWVLPPAPSLCTPINLTLSLSAAVSVIVLVYLLIMCSRHIYAVLVNNTPLNWHYGVGMPLYAGLLYVAYRLLQGIKACLLVPVYGVAWILVIAIMLPIVINGMQFFLALLTDKR